MNEKASLLQQISDQLDGLEDFQQLQIHIKRHAGKFSNTDYLKIAPLRYTTNEPNVTCTSDILRLIRGVTDAELTGNLTFSVTFKHGKADMMTVQDFKKL